MTPRRRRALQLGLVLLAVATAGAWWAREALSLVLARWVAERRLASDLTAELPDGLHLGLCGAGSPFPDELRAGPCTVVVAGPRLFVFDVGAGSVRNIGRLGFQHGRIDAVFLTHFHSDHLDGLGELLLQRWVAGARNAPLPVYGPEGVQDVVAGLGQAYAADRGYRIAHHGEAVVPPGGFGGTAHPFTPGPDGRVRVYAGGGVEVWAFTVDHLPAQPAVGYRISYGGRSIVLSGDTRKSAAVQREAAQVDLLVHEALSPRLVGLLEGAAGQAGRENLRRVFADIVDYHTTPREAAQIAEAAGAGALLFNHIVPALPGLPGLDEVFLQDVAQVYRGPARVGRDGDFYSLPAGSRETRHQRRF